MNRCCLTYAESVAVGGKLHADGGLSPRGMKRVMKRVRRLLESQIQGRARKRNDTRSK